MGIIPASGTAISMGRVRNAYGLSGTVRLNATLGPQTVPPIAAGAKIRLSAEFGGRTTPNDY